MVRKIIATTWGVVIAVSLANMAASAQTKQPRTVRDFFNLLPQKYFELAGCGDNPTKENCDRSRVEYLEHFLNTEDTANGYMSGGGEAGQGGFEMALFKRPDGTYIIGLTTWDEMNNDSYFLKYAGGKWLDVGAQLVPGYGKGKIYEMPRYGRTVEVYELKRIEDIATEYGRKLYDLVWRGGKFTLEKSAEAKKGKGKRQRRAQHNRSMQRTRSQHVSYQQSIVRAADVGR